MAKMLSKNTIKNLRQASTKEQIVKFLDQELEKGWVEDHEIHIQVPTVDDDLKSVLEDYKKIGWTVELTSNSVIFS